MADIKDGPLTADRLRALLDYDQHTGLFRWRLSRGRCARGSEAGRYAQGYVRIRVDGVEYAAHRLAWLHVHGHWPIGQIDHANRVRSDNRIANLRIATPSQNMQNRLHRNEDPEMQGITWDRVNRAWMVKFRAESKTHYIGRFRDLEVAKAACRQASVAVKKDFALTANTGACEHG